MYPRGTESWRDWRCSGKTEERDWISTFTERGWLSGPLVGETMIASGDLDFLFLPEIQTLLLPTPENAVSASTKGGCVHCHCSAAAGNQRQQIKGSERRTKRKEKIVPNVIVYAWTQWCLRIWCAVWHHHNIMPKLKTSTPHFQPLWSPVVQRFLCDACRCVTVYFKFAGKSVARTFADQDKKRGGILLCSLSVKSPKNMVRTMSQP